MYLIPCDGRGIKGRLTARVLMRKRMCGINVGIVIYSKGQFWWGRRDVVA